MGNEQKYPVGTKVKFIFNNKDKNKLGVVVGTEKNLHLYGGNREGIRYLVYIPTSYYPAIKGRREVEYMWKCLGSQIEPVITIGQQLLFDFMND